MEADNVAIIAQPHQHALAIRVGWAAAFDAILVCDEAVLVEAEAAIELLIIEQQQAGARAFVDLDLHLDLIGRVADNRRQHR